jgi:hypothetical protein
MNKEQALVDIHEAKHALVVQMRKMEDLIGGMDVPNPIAAAKEKCEFGKWLYSYDNHMREILGEQFYKRLEVLHKKWFVDYMKIFDMFVHEDEKTFLSKLLHGGNISSLNLDKAKLYFLELKETTTELLVALDKSERRLNALNESKFY